MEIDQLRQLVAEFCRERAEEKKQSNCWREPLLATAVADRRFRVLPEIATPSHLQPNELLATCRAVVVFFIPFTAEVTRSNGGGEFASKRWGLALSPTNELIEDINEFIRGCLAREGYESVVTPATYNFDKRSLASRWSHKHLAHITGLGRFGVNAQLITPSGCAGRLGSLVTEAPLGDHPLVQEKELCLHRAGKVCLECIKNCPVQALHLDGVDRYRCDTRIPVNRRRFATRFGMADDIEVCGKCAAGCPCSLSSPL